MADTDRVAVLGAAAMALSAAGSIADITEALVAALCPSFCDGCEVVLPDDRGTLWRVASGPGAMRDRTRVPVPSLDGRHPTWATYLDGTIRRLDIDDPAQAAMFGPATDPTSARSIGMRTALLLPLQARLRRIGVLVVGDGPSGRRFDATDEELAAVVAGLAGLAIENLESLRDQQAVNDRLRRAGAASAAFAAASTIGEVADVLVHQARDELGAARGLVYLVRDGDDSDGDDGDSDDDDGDGAVLELVASTGYRAERLAPWRTIARSSDRPVARAHRDGTVVVAPDADTVGRYYPDDATGHDDHAFIAVPLVAGGARLGAAFWSFAAARGFGEHDLQFVELMGEQAAASIRRVEEARLRAQVTSELAISQARLGALAHAGVIGIISGRDTRILEANEAFCSMLGLAVDAVVGGAVEWPALTPPEWAEVDERVVAEMLTTGVATPFEKEYLHADGRRVPVLVGGVTLSRSPFEWIVFVADITDRRAAEQRAEAARTRLQTLLDQQRSIARTLQTSLLPRELPRIPGADLAIHYWPANDELEVCGDLYDVFAIDDHRWALVVGDVCGKGVEAAAITAAARHSLRAAALHMRDPARVLRWVHDAIAAHPANTFCTVAFAVLDIASDPVLELALGGHDRAIVVSADGSTRDVGMPGTLLGLVDPQIHVDEVKLAPGDLLALFTDGITDAPVAEVMDRTELAALLAAHRGDPLDDIGEAVRDALAARRPNGSRDDAALLLLRLH